MKMFISGSEVPVWLGPLKQKTTSSWVPPSGMLLSCWIVLSGACSVPVNGVATLLLAPEILNVVPSALTPLKTAEPWNPAEHATLVCHVGWPVVLPVGGT